MDFCESVGQMPIARWHVRYHPATGIFSAHLGRSETTRSPAPYADDSSRRGTVIRCPRRATTSILRRAKRDEAATRRPHADAGGGDARAIEELELFADARQRSRLLDTTR